MPTQGSYEPNDKAKSTLETKTNSADQAKDIYAEPIRKRASIASLSWMVWSISIGVVPWPGGLWLMLLLCWV